MRTVCNRNLRTDFPDRPCQTASMENSPVTKALRDLRESAGVSLREMARRLGVPHSTYGHYEDPGRFKDPYLPMAWAIRFAEALEISGVERSTVIALAGVLDNSPDEDADARIARLSSRRRTMILQLLADLEAAEEADRARSEVAADDAAKAP